MARRLTPILCVLNIGPGRNLLIREFDPRDGFALASTHRQMSSVSPDQARTMAVA